MTPEPENIEKILTIARELMLKAKDIDIRVDSGLVEQANYNTGLYASKPNGTFTIYIRINGGAQLTEGEPIR